MFKLLYNYLFLVLLFFAFASCSSKRTSHEAQEVSEAVEKNAGEQEIIDLLNNFYSEYILDLTSKKSKIEDYCSKDLLTRLNKIYKDWYGDNFGDSSKMYALWEFSTGATDGDGESCINEIKSIGEDWYLVDFDEMGEHSTTAVKVKKLSNGRFVIDDYQSNYELADEEATEE